MVTALKKNAALLANDGDMASPKFSKAAQAAIDFAANAQISEGKLQMAIFARHIRAYMADKTYTDNAKAVLEAIRAKVVAHWTKHKGHFDNPERSVARVNAARMSEWRKIVRIGDWKCAETIIAYFEEDHMTFDDCKHVANFLIRGVDKKAAAPKKEALTAVIRAEKKAKTGRYDESGKAVAPDGKARPMDIGKAHKATARLAAGWKAFLTKEAATFKPKNSEAMALINAITENAGKLAALKATVEADA